MRNSATPPLSFKSANWYDSLEEALNYIQASAHNMESVSPETLSIEYNSNVKFVQSLAFIDLATLLKHEFLINVNNGIYEVEVEINPVVLFYEYCKWGYFDKFKEEVHKIINLKLLAGGFVAAINADRLQIVKYFVENNLAPVSQLYKSPLYETVFNKSITCFRYLSRYFEPQEQLLPYILEQNALEHLRYILETPDLMRKFTNLSQKDYYRIQDMNSQSYNNDTMRLFKEKFLNALAVHN